MAIVTEFYPVTKDRVGHPRTTKCGYTKVDVDGRTYLVLESYGSDQRAQLGKTSQSFHLDRERATELKHVLERAFPGI